MRRVNKILVSIKFGQDEIQVGELINEEKLIYFKYDASFIEKGIEISPFKLKLSDIIQTANLTPFEGLFGVFDDSLPDGWGRLLLDRTLISRGMATHDILPLDRLSHVGTRGMGALIYKPEFLHEEQVDLNIELDSIYNEMNTILSGSSSDLIEEIYSLGGSSGGARPKIFVGYNPKTDHLIYGQDILPEGYEHWIIKFPSSSDRIDIANIEYAYYKMALSAGIEMSESRLLKSLSGNYYFGTKRFDRLNNDRIHLHSVAGLIHDNFRLSNIDYGHIMDCAFKLENHFEAYEKVFSLASFNVFTNNRDDHSRNFSFLMDEFGKWKFSPAYDLTFSTSSHGMHSTSVSGESKNPGTKSLLQLSDYFRVKNANEIIEKVKDSVSNWNKIALEAGVENESLRLISKTISNIK